MKRTHCSACGHDDLDQFLDLGDSPIADAYTATPEPSPTYPLQVAVCGKCRLVQLLEVVEDLFGTGYSFYSSASPPLSAYHEAYARDILSRHHDIAQRGLLEVGCNDGDLLRHFPHKSALGVDPATGPAEAASERGCRVMNIPFSLAAAQRIRDDRGPFGVIVANHVLAHVADVSDMLAGIAHLMDDESVAMIEVQYLPDLLVNNAFDLVYHEHRNFFSLTSLMDAAMRHGLFVMDAELTDRQGGSLRVTLAKAYQLMSRHRPPALLDSELWLNSFGAYEGMQGRAERIRARLLDLLASRKGVTAGYGAPAKATTLLNFCGLTVDDIAWVIDSTPAKQGRHIPGTGIPILARRDDMDVDTFVLLAHNYAQPIIRQEHGFTAGGGNWIIPIPAPVVL